MSITDRTGRNLHEGQMVDVPLIGMYSGQVVLIADTSISTPDGRQPIKAVRVIFQIDLPVQGNTCLPAYITKSASKEESKIIDFPNKGA